MKLYYKYLKRYWHLIVLVAIFVSGQVATSLVLPKYMSRMINIGIQQKGIEKFVYQALREESYQTLLALSTSQEQEIIQSSYVKENTIYHLTKENNELVRITQEKNNVIFYLTTNNKTSEIAKIAKLQDIDKKTLLLQFKAIENTNMNAMLQSSMIHQERQKLGLSDSSVDYIMKQGLEMLLIAISGMIFVMLASYTASLFSSKIAQDIREELFIKIQSFSASELDKFSIASLITRVISDTTQIQNMIGFVLRIVMLSPLTAIGALIQSSNTNFNLMWTIALGAVCFVVLLVFIFIQVLPRFEKARIILDKINLVLRENLSGLRVIRAFNTQARQSKQFDDVNTELYQNNIEIGKFISLVNPGLMFMTNIIAVLIMYIGSDLVVASKLQIGDLLAFIQFATQVMFSFMLFGFLFFIIPQISIAFKRIDEVLVSENVIHEQTEKVVVDNLGTVEFKNVSFSYGSEAVTALDNLSFKVQPGQTVAFIGGTGSGKSTVGKLINRFYDIQKGEILIDGVDIKQYPLSQLRKKIGYVPQTAQIFSKTIKENIAYGCEEINENRVIHAARIACAESFINEKEGQYDYVLEQRGTNLSGGQKQRLQIARAIYKNTKILFFDDSFSALDYKTDATLRNNLHQEMRDVATIIVAQRIPTIMHADEIIVLDDGVVVGRGTHEQLIQSCKVYQDIASSQIEKENNDE